MKKALIAFMKTPVAGTVKTRLQADLGVEKTVAIYRAFVQEILKQCTRVRDAKRFLGCAPTIRHPFVREMADAYDFELFRQRGSDLGRRIVNAFHDNFKKGYGDIVLIGSDSPTIPPDFIRMAFQRLRKTGMVIGPCCDGGMYLIGARGRMNPRIFQNIPWDTSEVLNMVLKKIYELEIGFSLLPFWYDVDMIDDLRFLELHLRYLHKTLPL